LQRIARVELSYMSAYATLSATSCPTCRPTPHCPRRVVLHVGLRHIVRDELSRDDLPDHHRSSPWLETLLRCLFLNTA